MTAPFDHVAVPVDYGDGWECRVCGRPTRGSEARHAGEPLVDERTPAGNLVRLDDPMTSHEAIAAYEPRRDSALGRVAAFLRTRQGEWIDAVEFTARDVGGFAGTRRLRELRERGWPIETQRKPGSNTWQHRLTPDGPADAVPMF